MQQRLDYGEAAPGALQAMIGLENYLAGSSIELPLRELVKVRASQINGCAFCLDMHTKDARAQGETEQRLYGLSAWREAPYYTERERAALAWTEAVTLLPNREVPDDVYEEARKHFNEREIVDLTLTVVAINGWNRLAIAFRPPVGDYEPGQR